MVCFFVGSNACLVYFDNIRRAWAKIIHRCGKAVAGVEQRLRVQRLIARNNPTSNQTTLVKVHIISLSHIQDRTPRYLPRPLSNVLEGSCQRGTECDLDKLRRLLIFPAYIERAPMRRGLCAIRSEAAPHVILLPLLQSQRFGQ